MERFEKIDKGLQALEGPITVKLNNVSAMECNTIRHFFQGALNQFYKLAQVRTALHGSTIASCHMSNLPPRLQQQALYWQIPDPLHSFACILHVPGFLLSCNTQRRMLQMAEPVDMGLLGTASSQQTQQENRPPPRQLRRTQR